MALLKKLIMNLEICSFLQPTFTCLVLDLTLLLNTLFENTYHSLSENCNDIALFITATKITVTGFLFPFGS